MTTRPPTLFEIARAELRTVGIDLAMHPGTYCVNFRGASGETAYFTDDLADAIEHGQAMAASRAPDEAPAAPASGKPPRRKWRRRKMTPKAQRRRMIKAHNRRLRTRSIRQLATRGDDKA